MTESFPNFRSKINIYIHEVQKPPNRRNLKKSTQRHIIIKLSNVKDKETILKSPRKKWLFTYKVTSIRLLVISQQKSFIPEESAMIYSKCLKEKKKKTCNKGALCDKAVLQKLKLDEDFPRQRKSVGVHHH